jgi:O-antigen/teichoic acid export membrane protein
MTAFLGMAGTIIYGTLLTANGNLRELNVTSAIAVIINLILNLILIPKYHAAGAAIACLVTQVFAGFSQYLVCYKLFKFGLNGKLILKLTVYVALVVILGMLSVRIQLPWWIGFIGLMGVSMLMALALNLLNVRGMIKLVVKQ